MWMPEDGFRNAFAQHATGEQIAVSAAVQRTAAWRGPEGSLWIKALSGLYNLRGASCEQITEVDGYPGGFPAAVLVDREEPLGRRRHRGRGFFVERTNPSSSPVIAARARPAIGPALTPQVVWPSGVSGSMLGPSAEPFRHRGSWLPCLCLSCEAGFSVRWCAAHPRFYVSTAFLRLRISSITFSSPIAVLSMA